MSGRQSYCQGPYSRFSSMLSYERSGIVVSWANVRRSGREGQQTISVSFPIVPPLYSCSSRRRWPAMVCRKTVLALLFVSMALAVSCSAGGSPAPSPSATTGASPTAPTALSPSPTATASPVGADRPGILEDAEVVALEQGPEGHIPGNLALIIETGCWQCDGPTEGLTRVYSRPDGSA